MLIIHKDKSKTLMKRYQIGNIGLDVLCDEIAEKEWEKFLVPFTSKSYITISTKQNSYEKNYGITKLDLNKNSQYFLLINNKDMVLVSRDWKSVEIVQMDTSSSVSIVLLQVFYTHAVQRHMIQFHSSLIDYQGHGLMFLGPSGIGKTTQAELWNQYRDALIINGDIVFVQETEEAFLGWGTPWHGSSPYCENTNVPVEALIILKQAPENSIRKLEGFEKVTAVSNSVFYPRWLENGMELCLETLDHLLSRLPVYELSCRPDEEAVALTEQTIFGGERF